MYMSNKKQSTIINKYQYEFSHDLRCKGDQKKINIYSFSSGISAVWLLIFIGFNVDLIPKVKWSLKTNFYLKIFSYPVFHIKELFLNIFEQYAKIKWSQKRWNMHVVMLENVNKIWFTIHWCILMENALTWWYLQLWMIEI